MNSYRIALTGLAIIATLSLAALEPGKLHSLENTKSSFDMLIKDQNVVIDFYATWCPPCRQMTPRLQQLAEEFTNVLFIKVDIDTFGSISRRFGIKSIPTLIFFKDGKEHSRITGAKRVDELSKKIRDTY